MQLERMHLRKFGVSMQLIRVTSTRICDVSQQGRARAAAHLGVERDRRDRCNKGCHRKTIEGRMIVVKNKRGFI